jgi:hypothetical protein
VTRTPGHIEPPPPRGEVLRLAVIAIFFLAAPVAGDIGSSCEPAAPLDATKFFETKQEIDCQHCIDCHLTTNTCATACGPLVGGSFPQGCYPLVHDGEVCLDALGAASCTAYSGYVADQGATVPTECDFCPPQDQDAGTP